MVTEILAIINGTLGGLVTGLSGLVIEMFEVLVYDSTNGLTDFATYGLIFAFAGIVLTVITKLFRFI